MTSSYDVVIVGAGHGGAQAALALRQAGFEGSVAMVTDEADPPYERPPLSKDYLAGEKTFDRILIRRPEVWRDRDIDLILECRIVAVDPHAHRLTASDGSTFQYGKLIWATGGAPRKIPCDPGNLIGVHYIRTRADVDQLSHELPSASRIVIIGGGYIGLEAAAALSKQGKGITVLEAQDRVLARVAGEALSRFYEAEHRAHGVDVRLGVTVDCLEAENGRVTGVTLGDGTVLPAEIVIVGIGVIPAVEPLLAAGAAGGMGVDVDAFSRTSVADIYAVGDCARHHNAFAAGEMIRLESVQNANDQATIAAQDIVGNASPYNAVPWFWSNQFDLRLQTVGLSVGFDDAVLRGNPEDRQFSVIYLRRGKIIALDCVNSVKDYVQGKALVVNGAEISRALLEDASIPLKSLLSPEALTGTH